MGIYPLYIITIYILAPIDCVWSDWIVGDCSTLCGGGSRVKVRTKLVEEGNGGSCNGNTTENEECNVQKCSGEMTIFGFA